MRSPGVSPSQSTSESFQRLTGNIPSSALNGRRTGQPSSTPQPFQNVYDSAYAASGRPPDSRLDTPRQRQRQASSPEAPPVPARPWQRPSSASNSILTPDIAGYIELYGTLFQEQEKLRDESFSREQESYDRLFQETEAKWKQAISSKQSLFAECLKTVERQFKFDIDSYSRRFDQQDQFFSVFEERREMQVTSSQTIFVMAYEQDCTYVKEQFEAANDAERRTWERRKASVKTLFGELLKDLAQLLQRHETVFQGLMVEFTRKVVECNPPPDRQQNRHSEPGFDPGYYEQRYEDVVHAGMLSVSRPPNPSDQYYDQMQEAERHVRNPRMTPPRLGPNPAQYPDDIMLQGYERPQSRPSVGVPQAGLLPLGVSIACKRSTFQH